MGILGLARPLQGARCFGLALPLALLTRAAPAQSGDAAGGWPDLALPAAIALAVLLVLAILRLVIVGARLRRLDADHRQAVADHRLARAALAVAGDGVLIWQRDAGDAELPAPLADLLGMPGATRIEPARIADALVEADREPLRTALTRLANGGVPFDMTCRLAAGDRLLRVGGRTIDGGGGREARRLALHDVTALAAAAAAATRTAERLRAMLDALPLPVWGRRPDLSLEVFNSAYVRAVDASPAEAKARGLELVGGGDRAAGQALARRALAQGEPQREPKHIVVNGDRRLFELTEQPQPGGGLVGFALDMTAVEEGRLELERHIRAHAQVLESLSTSIVIFGSDGRLKFFNNEYVKQFDLDEDFLHGEPSMSEVLEALRERRRVPEHADFPRYKREVMRDLLSLINPLEELMHLPDGSTIRMVAAPHPFGGVIVTYEDVTDTLRLERSYNTLIEVQRETLDHLYEGIAVFGSDGRLKLSNPAYSRIWGLQPADLQNEPHVAAIVDRIREFFPSGPHWPRLRQRIIGRVADRDPRSGRLERTDGSVLIFASLPLPDGGCLYTYLDVTDTTRVERALRERNAALETADRLKSEFIANVSYELRTPLNAIIGFAEILNQAYFGALNERQAEYSRGILEASNRLLSLINDILDIATIEAGYMQLDLNPVDVGALLAGVEMLSAERARNRGLMLTVECAPDVGTVTGDERRLKQAIYNVVSNAIKFTPSGGRISILARREDDMVAISVVDTGIGIDLHDQAAVFEKFARINAQGRQSGAGLGLALVKKLVGLHRGRVELQSAPGKGTHVTCRIPLGHSAGADAPTVN